MTDDAWPEHDDEANDARPTSEWDVNNDTEAYAAGEAPSGAVPAFRSVDLGGPQSEGGASGFEQTTTNRTQQYGAPAPQAVAEQLRTTLTELDDVMPAGSSAWDLPANQTQHYGGPPASEPAAGGWAEGDTHQTQVYGTGGAPPDGSSAGADLGPSPTTDVWGDGSNRTQRFAPGGPAVPEGGTPSSAGGGDAASRSPQRHASSAPGGALAPPREESADPWGSPDNNTAFYAAGIQTASYPPPPGVAEGTEPNPPSPRSGTEPYGEAVSETPVTSAEGSGPRPASLEEAARIAADKVQPHRPAPRPELPHFAEIDALDEEAETLDTETTPADGPMSQDGWIPRGTVPTVGRAADSGGWEMSPPAGVNKADTSGPHIPKVKDPADFELEPPTTTRSE